MVIPSNCRGDSGDDEKVIKDFKDKYGVENIAFDDEPAHLFEYLRDRYLTIDIFEAESMFYYGSCKVPLFEFVR